MLALLFALTASADEIGARLARHWSHGWPGVAFVLPGGPADGAGLLAGDVLTEIDGKPTVGVGLEDLGAWLAGEGTVRLRVTRDGSALDLEIPRGPVDWGPVDAARAATCPGLAALRDGLRTGLRELRGEEIAPGTWRPARDLPWAAELSGPPFAARADLGDDLDAAVAALWPCLELHWSARAGEGVVIGRERPDGWTSAELVLEPTDGRIWLRMTDAEAVRYETLLLRAAPDAFSRGLDAVLAASPGGFADERRNAVEGGFEARTALPGTGSCRVVDGEPARYQCRYAPEPGESLSSLRERVEQRVTAAMTGAARWTSQGAVHTARRTTRAPEEVPVVTVSQREDHVTLTVAVRRVE